VRELAPIGVPINIDGKERHLLFTVNVIDDIQEHYNLPIAEAVIKTMSKDKESFSHLRYILMVLINEDVEIHNDESDEKWKPVTEKYVGRKITIDNAGIVAAAMFTAFTRSLPKSDEDDDDPMISER
jgi:hypothetical protein